MQALQALNLNDNELPILPIRTSLFQFFPIFSSFGLLVCIATSLARPAAYYQLFRLLKRGVIPLRRQINNPARRCGQGETLPFLLILVRDQASAAF